MGTNAQGRLAGLQEVPQFGGSAYLEYLKGAVSLNPQGLNRNLLGRYAHLDAYNEAGEVITYNVEMYNISSV